MALTGSDKAYLDARAGLARAGAVRANYYATINWHVTINGTARTTFLRESIEITEQINQQVDTAILVVFGFTPAVGQTIEIALGSADNKLFGGRIVKTEEIIGRRNFERVYWLLECVDHSWEMDKRLVTQEFASQDVGHTVKAIIDTYTTGFTTEHVQMGLSTPDETQFLFEPVSAALTRLANLIGGYWYVDANKDVHFFQTESLDGAPETVAASSNWEWRNVKHATDLSQVRTSIYAEGGGSHLITHRDADTLGTVDTSGELFTQGQVGNNEYLFTEALVGGSGGSDRWRVGQALYVPSLTYNTAKLTQSGAATAGATTLTLDSSSGLPGNGGGVVIVDDQIIHYSSVNTSIPSIEGIPSTGPGAILEDIPEGASVVRPITLVITGAYVAYNHEANDPVTTVRIRGDGTSYQTNLAAFMGGGDDGVREAHVIDDRRGYQTAAARGDAELVMWGDPREIVRYETRDINARSGKSVTVTVGSINDTFVIQRVTIRGSDVEGVSRFPWREVVAGTQRYDFYDVLARVEQGRL